jgi:hypothetical protein
MKYLWFFIDGLALDSALGYPKTLIRILGPYVNHPMIGLFTAMIEDENMGSR